MERKESQLLEEVSAALKQNQKPRLTEDGKCGTYIMRGLDQRPLAVFKPIDEEAFAPNNPRSYRGQFGDPTFREGVRSGEQTIRELAAYLLDSRGFSGVPHT